MFVLPHIKCGWFCPGLPPKRRRYDPAKLANNANAAEAHLLATSFWSPSLGSGKRRWNVCKKEFQKIKFISQTISMILLNYFPTFEASVAQNVLNRARKRTATRRTSLAAAESSKSPPPPPLPSLTAEAEASK